MTIQRVQPGPPLVIQTNTPLAVEPDDRAHLCPQPAEIDELRKAFGATDDRWTGYTRIDVAGGRVLYHVGTMVGGCRTVFFERVQGRLERGREFTDCNLEPFVDLDGDGIPEFLAPYSDSADAELKQLFPVARVLATYATGQ